MPDDLAPQTGRTAAAAPTTGLLPRGAGAAPADIHRHQSALRDLDSAMGLERFLHAHGAVYSRILRGWLPQDTEASVVDAACGPGWFQVWLRSLGYTNVLGYDASDDQVALAQSLGARVEKADAVDAIARTPGGSLAAVFALDFLEHLPRDRVLEWFRVVWKSLAPGGSLIMRLPNGESPFVGMNLFNDITHVWACTPVCLMSAASFCGFSAIEFRDESAPSIQRHRWLKVPLCLGAQSLMRMMVRAATRQRIRFLGPSLWCKASK